MTDTRSAHLVFDVDCLGAGDHEVNIRLAAKYKNFACDAVSSVCYREHAAQHSQNEFYKTPEVLFGHMFLLEQHLDRLSQEQLVSRRAELACQITMYMPSFDYWGLHADERARFQSIVQRVQTGLDAWLESAVAERVSLLLPYQVLQAAAPELMAMLALQSDSDWECIVTHDGSQAQLENIASALQMTAAPWRFRLLYCDSQNYAESLNAAALQASGEFFLALQATQSWPAGYLQRLVALLVTDETADIAALLPPSDADPFAAGVLRIRPCLKIIPCLVVPCTAAMCFARRRAMIRSFPGSMCCGDFGFMQSSVTAKWSSAAMPDCRTRLLPLKLCH